MGEREEATAASSHISRVFIGGLSASVTSADIEKTFASLGRVSSVEFVHTNDRSFAFMDFEPNSNKALAKLFATVSFLIPNPFFFPILKFQDSYSNLILGGWSKVVRALMLQWFKLDKQGDSIYKFIYRQWKRKV